MTPRTKRLLILAAIVLIICGTISGWTVVKVVAWARDLPDRIVIDGDAVATTLGHAVTESYHQALRDGDAELQLRILNEQFAPAIAENADALTWIRNEYGKDIVALVDSDDPRVSAAASDMMTILGVDDVPPASANGG